MSADWDVFALENVGRIVTGKTPSSTIEKAFSNSGVPFVTPKDMNGRRWMISTERYLTVEGVNSVKNCIVPKNSVAISCIGSDMGKAVLLHEDSVTNQQINSIIVDREKFNPQYIYYVLSTKQQELKDIAGGSATPILNKGHFGKFPIVAPSKEYQDRIAHVLDALDRRIELNTQTNQTLESIAQAIFKSWFVDFEPVKAKMAAKERWYAMQPTSESASPVCYADEAALPDLETYTNLAAMCAISGKNETELAQLQQQNSDQYQQLAETAALFPSAMVESELGEIPEGWGVKSLGEFISLQGGLSYESSYLGRGKPMATMGCVDPVLRFKRAGLKYYSGSHGSQHELKGGDIIISTRDVTQNRVTLGAPALIPMSFNKSMILATNMYKLVKKFEIVPSQVLFHILRTTRYREQIIASAKGTTVLMLTKDALLNYRIVMPPREILELAGKKFEILNKQMESLIEESNTLSEIRDSLLPKLLSGEIDLTNIQSEVA